MAKMTKSDPARTTAMGLFTDADEMVSAAKALMASGKRKVRRPIYYLLGHAIELVLKSYLLAKGETLDFVRNELGHNLEKAASLVSKKDTGEVSALVRHYDPHIKRLNKYYQAKQLEYRVTGSKRLPKASDLREFLEEMLRLVKPVARASLEREPAMTKDELIAQLCMDLNQAHDELMKAQGVEDPSALDWPEWSPQANSIREAEKMLTRRLAKTDAWTWYPTPKAVS